MKNVACSTSILVLAVTLVLLSPMVASQSSSKTKEIIERVCRSMEDYGFCYKVFNRDLPKPDTDVVGLTKITIVEAQTNATNTENFIIMQIPETRDRDELNHYANCGAAFQDLMDHFDQAATQFEQRDYKGMAATVRETPRIQAGCTTVFHVPPGRERFLAQLSERNRQMRILTAMAVVMGIEINK